MRAKQGEHTKATTDLPRTWKPSLNVLDKLFLRGVKTKSNRISQIEMTATGGQYYTEFHLITLVHLLRGQWKLQPVEICESCFFFYRPLNSFMPLLNWFNIQNLSRSEYKLKRCFQGYHQLKWKNASYGCKLQGTVIPHYIKTLALYERRSVETRPAIWPITAKSCWRSSKCSRQPL